MTPRQAQTLKEWLPLLLLFASGVVAWTTLQRDVGEALPATRFEAESIRTSSKLDAILEAQRRNQALILEMNTLNGERLKDICIKLQAGCR